MPLHVCPLQYATYPNQAEDSVYLNAFVDSNG